MSWFRSLKEEKIRTFFSEDYPQFLIEVYNELLKYENNPYNKNIKLLQLLLRRCEQLYIDVQIKYYKIDKNLDMFKNEIDFFAVTKRKLNLSDYETLRNHIINRINEFLKNEKNESSRKVVLQNLINQQPLSPTLGGGKRKTNKKNRVKKKKRKSKRVNRKM